MRRILISSLLILLVAVISGFGQTATSRGKSPIIIIPGLTGSELINSKTGEMVWFKIGRSKDDDVRLPMSADLADNRDSLIPGDIIRGIKLASFLPETEIYQQLIDSLKATGGFREAKWNTAAKRDYQDTFFVFPYDWRRDNVENAQLLVRKIEALKKRLGKPKLKFNIIAHSMGGLIARYAAMYGDSDLSSGEPKPNWAGARHLNKIFLLGTPNEGSVLALEALLNGVSYFGGGVNLPWVRNLSRFDIFTIPSIFELLPHRDTLRAFDDELRPMHIDIFDPLTWDEYDWSIWKDKDFDKKFDATERKNARAYFLKALARAKNLQAALDANSSEKIPVSFYLMGADCKDTLNAVILRRDEEKDKWITQFKPDSFTNSLGQKITTEQIRAIIYSMGDSVVPKRSLAAESLMANGHRNALPITAELYQCEDHAKLVTNPDIQRKLFDLLDPLPGR